MQLTDHHLFNLLMLVIFGGIVWLPATWLLLSVFTPRSLLERYFKEPHFTLTETYMLREFPGSLARTGIFAWLLLVPALDRKRNIKNVRAYIPLWYAIGLRVFMIGAVLTIFLLASLMTILSLTPVDTCFLEFSLRFPFISVCYS